MGLLNLLFGPMPVAPVEPPKRNVPPARSRQRVRVSGRSFLSGDSDPSFENFFGAEGPIDDQLHQSLGKMRARSRALCQDSDFARKFLTLLKSNVIGRTGIALVPQSRKKTKDGWELDKSDNQVLKNGWDKWCKAENCTVTKGLSWREVEKLYLTTVARDGECFVRLVEGFDNEFGFAVQILEGDSLDIELNAPLRNGTYFALGVEKNEWGAPVAYYFRDRSARSVMVGARGPYLRIPAEEIIHGFVTERVGQSRGIPWMNTSIRSVKMLDAWLEAELVGTRVASSKMGFFTSKDGREFVGDDEDADGTIVQNAEPGTFEQLPEGLDFQKFDADYPNSSVSEFVKVILRSAAAGVGMSYNSMANDLESVNYSSLRAGTIEEREVYRDLQAWQSETLSERVYKSFLKMALLKGAFSQPLPASKFGKFSSVAWQPRGWQWVDPLKDIQAAERALKLGLTTRAAIVSSQGTASIGENIEQLAQENLMAEAANVNVSGVEGSASDEGEGEEPTDSKGKGNEKE